MLNWLLSQCNHFLYTYVLLVLLLGCGLYFTIRTHFVQIRLLPEAFRVLGEQKARPGSTSSFQALMISTASRVGTGNIAGVCTALALGGPGAVFWMWVTALIGSASAFAESTLAQIYKVPDGSSFRGGPAYYMQKALEKRWLGILFSILLIFCFSYGFNALQAFNISSSLRYYIGSSDAKWLSLTTGGILALLSCISIFGGMRRIRQITSATVPFMALFYLAVGLIIILKNITKLPLVLGTIFQQAFDWQAIWGGFASSSVMFGIKRGLFSNEAGMGSAPCAAASADVSHPVKQGFVQMISVFIDTLLICTTTAMIALLSGVPLTEQSAGIPLIQSAIRLELGSWGIHFITLSIFLFAFSSLIGNYYYAESNLKFISSNPFLLRLLRITTVAAIFLGSQLNFDTAWNAADLLMGLMATLNIITLFCLGNTVSCTYQDYLQQKKSQQNPVFHPERLHIENTDVWN